MDLDNTGENSVVGILLLHFSDWNSESLTFWEWNAGIKSLEVWSFEVKMRSWNAKIIEILWWICEDWNPEKIEIFGWNAKDKIRKN
jgi:hypothetical protein